MKKVIFIFGLIGLLIISGFLVKKYYFNPEKILKKKTDTWNKRINEFKNELDDGDLIFQTSLSRQSNAPLGEVFTSTGYGGSICYPKPQLP